MIHGLFPRIKNCSEINNWIKMLFTFLMIHVYWIFFGNAYEYIHVCIFIYIYTYNPPLANKNFTKLIIIIIKIIFYAFTV